MEKSALLALWARLPHPLQWVIKWVILPKHLLGVVAVILDGRGKIMLFKHTYRKGKPWGLPGGWVNARERPSLAIVREVKEETGCNVEVKRLLLSCESPRRNHLTVVFLCTELRGEFIPSAEVTAFRYFPLAEVEDQLEQSQADIFGAIRTELKEHSLLPS